MNPFSAPIFIPSTLQSPFSRHPCQLVCSFLNNFSNIKTSKFSFCLSQKVETVAHMWSIHFIFFSLYFYIYKEKNIYIYIHNWCIVALQSSRCTARWFSYTYTHILFFSLFSIIGISRDWQRDYSSQCYIVKLCWLLLIFFLN